MLKNLFRHRFATYVAYFSVTFLVRDLYIKPSLGFFTKPSARSEVETMALSQFFTLL